MKGGAHRATDAQAWTRTTFIYTSLKPSIQLLAKERKAPWDTRLFIAR
jgi:hypothetical protein